MNNHIIILCASLLLLVACGSKKQNVDDYSDTTDWAEQKEYLNRDSTIYGVCTDGLAMNTLQLLTDNGDTLTLSTVQANENGRLFGGGFSIGDHVAVLVNRERNEVVQAVNLNTLMGDWVMPNPVDGGSYMGVSIRDGGVAESINQNSLIYKTWRLVNGTLEMMYVREGGGNFEEVELYRMFYLSDDSLAFGNADEIFEYTRPRHEEDYSDVKLDEDDLDDNMML